MTHSALLPSPHSKDIFGTPKKARHSFAPPSQISELLALLRFEAEIVGDSTVQANSDTLFMLSLAFMEAGAAGRACLIMGMQLPLLLDSLLRFQRVT